MVRSKVFPVDDIPVSQISDGLNRFNKDGKIVRYIADKHKCIQIVNWWKHQKPQWAGKSIYPPCENWTDRERYHTTKNDICNVNWNSEGGFPSDYIARYIDGKVNNDVKYEVKSDIKSEIESEGEPKTGSLASASNYQVTKSGNVIFQDKGEIIIDRSFSGVTGFFYPSEPDRARKTIELICERLKIEIIPENERKIIDYLTPFYHAMINRTNKSGRKYSSSNMFWLFEWASVGEIPSDKKSIQEEVENKRKQNNPVLPTADPDCELCHGKGKRKKYVEAFQDERYVQCECVKVREEVEV